MELDIIWISAGVVACAGLVLGLLIAITAKKFEVEQDPRIDIVQNLLPGANCGGCGYAGCSDLANAIVTKGAPVTSCPVCSEENRKAIAAELGVEAGEAEKMVAVVLCGGSHSRSFQKAQYNGIMDCRSASIVANGGGKACRYGCLGYGSCARACSMGAIEMRDGLAVVHPELCGGCGKCVSVCPRKLIKLVPATAKVHIYCNSLDKPQQKRKVCTVPCLTCRKCMKGNTEGDLKILIQEQLIRVNYSNMPDEGIVEQAGCPTGALQKEADHRALMAKAPACNCGKEQKS